MDSAEKDSMVSQVEKALDECASAWENVVVQLQGRLLPDNFFGDGQEWRTRAMKYIKEMELLDIANWYRYKLPNAADNIVASEQDMYSYMEQNVYKYRPRRYKVLTARLAAVPELSGKLPCPRQQEVEFCRVCGIQLPEHIAPVANAPPAAEQGTQNVGCGYRFRVTFRSATASVAPSP